MLKIFILAKTLLKSGGLLSGEKGRRRWWIVVLLIAAFAAFGFSVGMMALGLYDAFDAAGAADALLTLTLGATSAVIFMFGVFYAVSVMYHADDVPLLMALPLRPYQILGGKFLTLIVYEYIFEAFILLPVLVVYGIKSGGGLLYASYAALVFLLLPVIALVMACVLVMLVMRFTRFGKNKQLFNYIGGIIAMALAVGFNLAVQTSMRSIGSEQITAFVSGEKSLNALLGHIFPGIGFASAALTKSAAIAGLFNLALFVLCIIAALAVFMGLGQLVYFKGLSGVTEASAKRRLISHEELGRKTAHTPLVRACLKKELRMLVRSPVAFLNCVLMNFIWPVLLLFMAVGSGESLDTIRVLLSNLDESVVLAVFVGFCAFVSSANAITSTALSREGKTLFVMKYIPVALKKQVDAKALAGLLLSGISIMLLTVAGFMLGINIWILLAALVIGFTAAAASAYAGLLIDAANPKLNWMSEQQAIKQNLNVVLHMLAGLLFALLIILPVLLTGMGAVLTVVYLVTVSGIAALVFSVRGARSVAARIEKMNV